MTLRCAGAGARDDATAAGSRFGFRVRSFADDIRVIGGQRDSEVCIENTVAVGGTATPETHTKLSFREPAPTPTRFERPTDRRLPPTRTATCARSDMGNVECCASGRFQEGKPPKKPKNKKNKKKQAKVSETKNGVGGGKGDGGGVQKVVTVAEDASERAAPAETLVQAAAPASDTPADEPSQQQDTNSTQPTANTDETDADAPRNESMAVARERFFGQVQIYNIFWNVWTTIHALRCQRV